MNSIAVAVCASACDPACRSRGTLVYLRNRWYDPNTGRFTQQDPIGYAGGSNLYGYTGGDPVSYSDPYGLDCKKKEVKCPEAGAFVSDSALMKGADRMYKQSAADGRERGAFLFRNSDGTTRVGEVKVGQPNSGTVDLGKPPDNAVGEIHTHPDRVLSGGWVLHGGPPSGPDAARAGEYHIHSVVVGQDKLYVVPWNNSQGYYTYDRPKSTP